MNHKLSRRIFFITLGLLILLMGTTLIFQTFFFEKFYENKKNSIMQNELNKFKNMYSYELSDDYTIPNAIKTLEDNTNSVIAIFSLNSEFKYVSNRYNTDSDTLKTLAELCKDVLNDSSVINTVLNNDTIIKYNFKDKSNSIKIGMVTSMSLSSKNDSILISVSPIQPIEEAASVMNEFYIYVFIGFIFLSAILSSIYSNTISKPLIKMNNVALKMTKMNFNEKCAVDRDDEIGNLASTLNFLSTNLDEALKDLKEKNKKLEEDIEKERNLEVMRKDFIASVSHELKTPIGIIEGYAEGIKDGIVSNENAEVYLDTIIDESKKMGVLVANMLELSKLESGIIKPNMEAFNINRLINKVIHKHSISATDHGLTIEFNQNTDYSYVNADIFQMEQVLTNLITNAIKYTPSGNRILVSIGNNINDDNSFEISVLNEGSHIDSSELDKLFNKFYRVDKSRQRNSNSTGLGLSIVKNILELHNFKYSLNNIDTGVEFKYFIPKVEIEDDYED